MGPGTLPSSSVGRCAAPGEKIKLVADDKIRRVVMCSGKVYYDLYEEREKRGIDDVYLLRVEQLYPVPLKALVQELGRVQERANSCGARKSRAIWARTPSWTPYLEWVLGQIGAKHRQPIYAGRRRGRDRLGQMPASTAQGAVDTAL